MCSGTLAAWISKRMTIYRSLLTVDQVDAANSRLEHVKESSSCQGSGIPGFSWPKNSPSTIRCSRFIYLSLLRENNSNKQIYHTYSVEILKCGYLMWSQNLMEIDLEKLKRYPTSFFACTYVLRWNDVINYLWHH